MKSVISVVLNNFTNDSRVLKESISLQNAGYKVTVIALHQEALKEQERVQEIAVHRIKLKSRSWSKNKMVQLIKYFEFLYRAVKEYKKSDIIHCNDLNALPVGVVIKKFYNKDAKIVYDAHEYETQMNGLKGINKKLVALLEKSLIGYANSVITVSDAIACEYVRLYSIPKPALVLNTPPFNQIEKKDIFREVFNIPQNKTIFLYQGSLSKGRGIEIVLETFKALDTVIVFMGYGVLEEMILIASKEYSNIYFHKAVSPKILLDYTSSADFGISTIEDTCLSYRYSLPNKMFEYMMADIPLIVSNLPEMKKIVEDNSIGVVLKENSIEGITQAIEEACYLDKEELASNLQKAKKIYNWENQEKILLEVYHGL